MPRAFSSGAVSIWSYALYSPKNLVIAAVSVRLAVVDVADRPDVHVRLRPLKFAFAI